MSKWIAAAGALSFAFIFAHVVGGDADVHSPILVSDLTDVLKGYVSVVWHMVTATMILCTGLLIIAARSTHLRTTLTLIVVIQYALFAVLFVFYGALRFGSLFVMPPWIGFVVICLVALVGLWLERGRHTSDERLA